MMRIRAKEIAGTVTFSNMETGGLIYITDRWPKTLDVQMFLRGLFGSPDEVGYYVCHEDAGIGDVALMHMVLDQVCQFTSEMLLAVAVSNPAKLPVNEDPDLIVAAGVAMWFLVECWESSIEEAKILVRLNLYWPELQSGLVSLV